MAKNNKSKENSTTKIEPQLKFLELNLKVLYATFILVFGVFCFSVFKNIQYPLFWADESMTVVGAQRVLEFGYPKVHDGKNVFYDLRHSNPTLGIDPKTDAYVGGTGWGHYYFAAIPVKFAESISDIYAKTGLIRSFFAFIGVVGLLVFVWLTSSIFNKIELRLIYASLFFFLSLFSVSLALMLREARYYSLCIFLGSIILGLYIKFRFGSGVNQFVFRLITIVALVFMFFTFAPLFFILIAALGISEAVVFVFKFVKTKSLVAIIKQEEKVISSLLISLLIIYPFLSYFKTFEISEAMASFNGYSKKMFWENFATVFKYFKNFELLYLAVALKVLVLFSFKKYLKINYNFLAVSFLFLLIFGVYAYLIARIPNFIYTRYIIMLQPVLVGSIVFDFVLLVFNHDDSSKFSFAPRYMLILVILITFTLSNVFSNSKFISGHITELFNIYRGPLDETIPAIKAKYGKTDTLVIASNYEETSYMYYLGAKVTVGFIGNNLEDDAKVVPYVMAYRKPWGNFTEIFQNFMRNNIYIRESYSVYDNPVNNIPELNFMPAFNHKFATQMANSEQEKVELYFKK